MTHFPEPLFPPEHVAQSRQERLQRLLSSSRKGITIRFAIIIFELFGVLVFGSSALFMDALASLIDVASSLLLVACVKLADRPPDEDHPFGHGRYEPLIGLQMGFLMTLIGGGMLFQQFFELFRGVPGKIIDPRTWIIPLCAVILLETCYQLVIHTAKKENSPALMADAIHYRLDGITSLFAMLALLPAAYFPEWSGTIDHIGAIFIAFLMIAIGIYAWRKNLHQIMDRVPDSQFFERVHLASMRVPGVFGTEKTRIQLYGPDAHVNIDIEVDPQLSVELAHAISQKVRVEIQKEWPAVRDVIVHIEPYYPNDH
jgi:cation diffusion facilitator family transporter